MPGNLICCCLFILLASGINTVFGGTFDLEEIQVVSSPAEARRLDFKGTEKVLDFDAAKDGPKVAILLQNQGGFKVVFWDLNAPGSPEDWLVPKEFSPRALAWHPLGKSFFLAGKQGDSYMVMRVDKAGGKWTAKSIYSTRQEIRRLVPAPRPYEIEADYTGSEPRITKAYRIFFGVKNPDGTYAVKSVTEDGKREYQAIGAKKGFTSFKDADASPSRIEARWALPLAFHPAGHVLLWEDDKRNFHYALYQRDHWEQSTALSYPGVSGGTLTATPNGMGLIHWVPGLAGVTVVSGHGKKKDLIAAEWNFISTPSPVPDGRGILGLVRKDTGTSLAYEPVQLPLADVANAWMFADGQGDRELFSSKGGLFRDLPDDQLYAMYESEAYECGGYDQSTPTRPYLVTTDVFWELLAAAYEGIFIVQEKQRAIPAFWEFINGAEEYFRRTKPDSPWFPVFSTLANMRKAGDADDNVRSELARIQKAGGMEYSSVLRAEADYGELKPRGHYDSSEEMKTYFKAFKYLTLTAMENDVLPLDDLEKSAPEVKAGALSWIAAYKSFIAPSRSQVAWGDGIKPPPYAMHLDKAARLFPLSWGMDNEVLLTTVYHQDWPEAEQIKGPSGERLIPSGLDVASALGSEFARALLSSEFEKYPPLGNAMEGLRKRLAENRNVRDASNLYDPWISALAMQWAEDVASPGGSLDRELWRAKRLQTGLASWATLRHATVLVNERTAAECGEAAFEPILLTPPRGYVEADPKTFDAIAVLFDSLGQLVESWKSSPADTIQVEEGDEREALKEGILHRLSETAEKARLFKIIAEKEIREEPLTNAEYEEILYIGRIAEHHLLIFKSLASEEHALSNPDPMPKITDVAGGGPYKIPLLMAGVGRPMEWDHVVPYFGRRQIVKGAVYSYYEFVSERLMNDKEWLQSLPTRKHPEWIAPFMSGSVPACPPRNPF
jgi:hypothetical protein